MALTFLLGGARSGKSALAVRLASSWPGRVVFLATAEPRDGEMAARIGHHRRERSPEWTTLEVPVELARAVAAAPEDAFLVIDCLTLWVSNLLEAGFDDAEVERAAAEVVRLALAHPAPTVVVSKDRKSVV